MKNRQNFLMILFVMMLALPACSSSQVEESSSAQVPGESMDDTGLDVPTDSVAEESNGEPPAPPSNGETPQVAQESTSAEQTLEMPAAPTEVQSEALSDVPTDPNASQAGTETTLSSTENTIETPVSNSDSTPMVVAEQTESALDVQDQKGMKNYRVKAGDTLMKIAFEHYGDLYRWREILEMNRDKVRGPASLEPGLTLKLSGMGLARVKQKGSKYLIKRGDTLGIISKDVYGTQAKWKKLWENNRQLIRDPNRIYAGFFLYYVPENQLSAL